MSKTNETKKQALLDLLEFSLLFTQKQRRLLTDNLDKFSDEEINGLGKVLAAEHKDRENLDKEFVKTFLETVKGYDTSKPTN
jgi:hypothetical protein